MIQSSRTHDCLDSSFLLMSIFPILMDLQHSLSPYSVDSPEHQTLYYNVLHQHTTSHAFCDMCSNLRSHVHVDVVKDGL